MIVNSAKGLRKGQKAYAKSVQGLLGNKSEGSFREQSDSDKHMGESEQQFTAFFFFIIGDSIIKKHTVIVVIDVC